MFKPFYNILHINFYKVCLGFYIAVFYYFQSVWKKLEKITKEKFPACVLTILQSAGYDNFTSLNEMNDEKIERIEKYIDSNKYIINELNCCYSDHYKQLGTFIFLPGHRSIIEGIPEQIKRYQDKSENSAKSSRVSKVLQKDSISDEDLQMKLIKNLTAFSGKVGHQFPPGIISKSNIHDYVRVSENDDVLITCRFSCPFCSKSFKLTYKNFWTSSKVTQHLKGHINEDKG